MRGRWARGDPEVTPSWSAAGAARHYNLRLPTEGLRQGHGPAAMGRRPDLRAYAWQPGAGRTGLRNYVRRTQIGQLLGQVRVLVRLLRLLLPLWLILLLPLRLVRLLLLRLRALLLLVLLLVLLVLLLVLLLLILLLRMWPQVGPMLALSWPHLVFWTKGITHTPQAFWPEVTTPLFAYLQPMVFNICSPLYCIIAALYIRVGPMFA